MLRNDDDDEIFHPAWRRSQKNASFSTVIEPVKLAQLVQRQESRRHVMLSKRHFLYPLAILVFTVAIAVHFFGMKTEFTTTANSSLQTSAKEK